MLKKTVSYEFRKCPKCGSKISRVRLTSQDNMLSVGELFYVSKCAKCGLFFQNPALKQEFLSKHYPEDYAPYSDGEMAIGRSALYFIRKSKGYSHLPQLPPLSWPKRIYGRWSCGTQLFPNYVKNGNLLEVACASGNRLELLRKLGWSHCVGIEYSEYAAEIARKKGFVVHCGRVEDKLTEIPENSLDVIIASFVMEHVENPFLLTNLLSSKLKPGGQFIFSTLNINSPDFRLYKENWYDLDLQRHFTFFRKRDIYSMLEEHFKIVNVYYQAASNDYAGSARYYLKNSSTHGPTRFINKLIAALGNNLNLVCLSLALLRHTTRIVVHARKIK